MRAGHIKKYRPRFLKAILYTLIVLLGCTEAKAIEEPYLNELKGAQVAAGSFFTVADEKFNSTAAWNLIQQNISVNDIVSFEINFDSTIFFYDKPFTCTINFKIYIYGNQADTSLITDSVTHSNISLQVKFDTVTGKPYKGIALYKFTNAHKYRIKILNITSPQLNPIPAIFRLKAQVIVDRQYIFQDNSTDVTRYAVSNGNQLQLTWTPSNYPGAESFDLEYTHIDGASQLAASIRNYRNGNDYLVPDDTLAKWFLNNNTRITTAAAGYLINVPYDSGFVLFRVRGVQVHYPDGVRWEGNWNYKARNAGVTCTSCPSGIVFFSPHESKLNWQYAAQFAEGGLRKETVSYFDGTLRNRQSVAIASSENRSVVQETIYDALGRPTLNVLPVPANDSTIHYFRGFNKNKSGNPYSFSDLLYNSCILTPDSISASSGAGRYYSANNDFINRYHYAKYIPSAEGYPFVATDYMADNTGKIRAQGGVGAAFQLNSGHATKYYYGKPLQKELDRLFGTEAGNASHYMKDMAMDPNGQIVVSYLDASGKTVASALAGAVPRNLHALPSVTGASTMLTNDLLKPDDFVRNPSDYSIAATTTFTAPVTGTYVVKYRVDPLRMEKWFGARKDSVICNNCYYDLLITIKNDCNEIIKQETKAAGNVFDTSCANPPGALTGTLNTAITAIGEYYVTCQLVISGEALDYYDSVHLVKNTEIKKLNYFLLNELRNTDFYGCYNNCETCIDALGTKVAFTQQFKSYYIADSLKFTREDSLFVLSLYDSLYSHCRSIQGQCAVNVCDEKLELLKLDVAPGGQYALYDTATFALLEPQINVLAKRNQIVKFTDASGKRDSVTVYDAIGENPVRIDVKELSDSMFIKYWKKEWADSLVRLHPEYCQYLWCVANSSSFAFDKEITNWIDADSVKAKGWFNPAQYDAILSHDPFFRPGGLGASLKNKMKDSLRLFSRTFARTSLSDKNILGFIDVVLYCKDQANGWESCFPDSACRSRNREWFLYSQLYVNLKLKFYEEARRTSSNPVFANCVNCYIGKDALAVAGVLPGSPLSGSFTDPTCNEACPAGIYDPYDRDSVSLYIQYGQRNTPPSNVPFGYGNCQFYNAYLLKTGSAASCKFFNVWVCTFDSTCAPLCAPITELKITGRTANSLTASWKPSASPVTQYEWEIYDLNNVTTPLMKGGVSSATVTITGLQANRQYKFRVRTLCQSGKRSDWAAIECATALPPSTIRMSCSDVNCTEQGIVHLTFNFNQPTAQAMTFYFGEIKNGANGTKFAIGYDLFALPPGVQPATYAGSNVPLRVDIPAGVTSFSTNGTIFPANGSQFGWICHSCLSPIADIYMKIVQPSGLLQDFEFANTQNQNTIFHNLSAGGSGPGSTNCPQTVFPAYECAVDTSRNYPSSCPNDPNAALYRNKQRRYPEYVNTNNFINELLSNNPQQNSTEKHQASMEWAKSNCVAQSDIWINQLRGCTTDQAKLAQLKQALIDICSAGVSTERVFGASSIPDSIPATWHSFDEAIAGILGTSALSANCTAELLSSPYPYDRQPVYVERMIMETNYAICEKIGQYKSAWQSAGAGLSFHSWLLRTLGRGYQLDSVELDDLLNSCTNCNGLLKNDIVLPVAFEPNTQPCLTCTDIQSAISAFNLKFPGLTRTHDNYEILLANFFNHRFGYTLTYVQFKDYLDSCTARPQYAAKLCNQALVPEGTIDNNGNACMADLFATALTNASNRYIVYIDSVRRDFREAYMTRCMNVQPSLTMTAELFEYHYTLRYFDQSRNLVKTIPPEGVVLLDSAQLELVKYHRLLQTEGCYQYSDSIRLNNNGEVSWSYVNNFVAGAWTTELFTNLSAHSNQVLLSKVREYTYDTSGGVSQFYRHAGFVVKIESNKLVVELYGIGADTMQRKVTATSLLTVPSILPLNRWLPVAIGRTTDTLNPLRVWINGNPVAMQVTANRLDSAVEFGNLPALVVGTHYAAHLPMPGKIRGTVKNLRLYNRLLETAEVRQNAYNNCQLPVNQNGLIFWSPMNDATNNLVKDLVSQQNGQLTGFTWQPFAGVFPKHKLPTTYQYNSFNQVVQQFTPDADTSQFWYDHLGRLMASQNKEQKVNPSYSGAANRYSYIKYDALGRNIEVGEKSQPATDIRTIDLLDSTVVKTWISSGTDRQVTKSIYDNPVNLSLQPFATSRKRIVASVYLENASDAAGDSTLYGYDLSGNIKTLLQHIKALVGVDAANGKKRIDYDYDLVTGRVNLTRYQEGKGDQFFYKYQYDADNRLVRAYSSRDKLLWNEEASYQYYLHGPVARVELGKLKVQGIDYAYTLQGWIKGINGDALDPAREIGKDGQPGTTYGRVSRDVFSLQLGYYTSDYKPVGGSSAAAFAQYVYQTPTSFDATGNSLFNSNINSIALALSKISNGATVGYTYGYDQLSRLIQMRHHTITGNWSNSQVIAAYRESVAYDANGNIQKYLRQGADATGMPLTMDSLTYNYNRDANGKLVNNKLNYVRDQVNAANYGVDIDNQSAGNYQYDRIGNLVKDVSEGIDSVRWTVYGKLNRIKKNTNVAVNWGYDAMGNRTWKQETAAGITTSTFYVRDLKGDVLAVYEKAGTASLKWAEQHLYGGSRLGIWSWDTTIPAKPPVVQNNNPVYDSLLYGGRSYELNNHLGNVLATISDKKIGVKTASSNVVEYYTAESLLQQDYYPFGMLMPGRQYGAGAGYRYGFNGKENDNEVKGLGNQQDYGMRIYDNRIGRFLSVDPITKMYPELTPYQFASNRPIDGVDLDGLEYVKLKHIVDASGKVMETHPVPYYLMDDKTLQALGGTPKGTWNAAGFGPEGRGIKHEFYRQDGTLIEERTLWNLRQNSFTGHAGAHGLYSGPGSITYEGEKDYDFRWKPIDQADAIAKRHDYDYSQVGDIGDKGAYDVVEDTRTYEADMRMVDATDRFLKSIPVRVVLGERVAGETVATAASQKAFIAILADYKKWKAGYMRAHGLDPDKTADNKKVSLGDWRVKLAYVRPFTKGYKRRLFNLGVLLLTKSQTSSDDSKKDKNVQQFKLQNKLE